MNNRPLRRFRSVNSNSADFPTLTTEIDLLPGDAGTAAGRAILPLVDRGGSGSVARFMEVWPFGLGSDNDVFSLRVIGWRRVVPLISDNRQLWVPGILCDAVCTLSTFVGRAGFPVIGTERFADTVTRSIEPTKTATTTLLDGFVKYHSPANNTPGRFMLELDGHDYVELQFDQTTGTPTMNALYALLDHC